MDKVELLEKQLNNTLIAYNDLEYKFQQYKEIVTENNKKEDKDYWAWQPDEDNHLESLTCPVLIPAEWLRNIMDDCYLEGLKKGYKLNRKFNRDSN